MPTRLPTPPPEPETYPNYDVDADQDDEEPADSCLKCHDFSPIDDHASQFPREHITSLDQLAYDLTSPWDSETEKSRAIFTWLHHNIAYDTHAFFSGNIRPSTAESTLRSGLAVCDGYAGLFKSLAEKAGLQAHRVTGHGKGFGHVGSDPDAPPPPYDGNHAWNCVLMDGEWRLIDSCWGAGAVEGSNAPYQKRFNPFWFTCSNLEFRKKHFPEDPSYQLIPDEEGGPESWEEYIMVPEGPTIFGEFYNHQFDQQRLEPAERALESGGWHTFSLFKVCEHMSREEADNWVYFINTPDDNRTPLTPDDQGGWSAQVYIPKGGGEVSLYFVTQFDRRDAKGLAIQDFVRGIGRKAMSFGGLARWTLV